MDRNGCRFCSLAPDGLLYRSKTINRVLEEISYLINKYEINEIDFLDLVITKNKLRQLAPSLSNKFSNCTFSGEVRANIGYEGFSLLHSAGFGHVQIGIESFSTNVLRKMNKGIGLKQVIEALRCCKIYNIKVAYNLLWGVPDEKISDYKQMLELMAIIPHLHPPVRMIHIQLERFCDYVKHPFKYEIKNLRTSQVFSPQSKSSIGKHVSYLFIGDYSCETHKNQEVIASIYKKAQEWKHLWYSPRYNALIDRKIKHSPELKVVPLSRNQYRVIDTRDDSGVNKKRIVNKETAKAMLVASKYDDTDTQRWIVENRIGVVDSGWLLPLATTDENTMKMMNG